MDKETISKANVLIERIDKLKGMQIEMRPQFCTGVGVSGTTKKNDDRTYYAYDLWSLNKTETDDNSLIMYAGIKAMHGEVCRLLELAEEDLEQLS